MKLKKNQISNMKGDLRALPSEEFALRKLGLQTKHCIKSEEESLY